MQSHESHVEGDAHTRNLELFSPLLRHLVTPLPISNSISPLQAVNKPWKFRYRHFDGVCHPLSGTGDPSLRDRRAASLAMEVRRAFKRMAHALEEAKTESKPRSAPLEGKRGFRSREARRRISPF